MHRQPRALVLPLYAIAGFAAIVAAVQWYLTTEGRMDGRTDRQIDRKSYAIRTSDLRGDGSESGPARLRGQSLPSRSATGRAPSAFGFGCRLPSPPHPCQLSAPHPEAKSEVPPAIDGGRGGAAPVTAAESGKEAGRNFYWFVSRQCYDTTAPRPVANMTHMCEVRSFWAYLVSATCDYIETRTSVEQGIAYSLYQFYSLSYSEDCIFQINATSL